jgi:hypothetical protein
VVFVVDNVALGQVSSEYFGFPCQFSCHQILHTPPSSCSGTISQLVAAYQSGLSFTPTHETKKNTGNGYRLRGCGSKPSRNIILFLSAAASKPALEPTQLTLLVIAESPSLGIKRPGCQAIHLRPSTGEVKMPWRYARFPIRFRGTVDEDKLNIQYT